MDSPLTGEDAKSVQEELAEARRIIAEQRLGREKAERAIEEERRGRKEDRDKAERAIKEDREKAELVIKEERLGREKAERAAEKERLRREKADLELRRTTIPEFLGFYNRVSQTVKVETNPSVLTSGETSKPAGRKYPKRIVPWDNFAKRQKEIWDIICASPIYSEQLFASKNAVQKTTLVPVRSEGDVVANEGVTVLQPVEAILQQFFEDEELRQQLRIPGHVRFVNFLNLDPGTKDASTLPKEDHPPLSSNPITPIPSSKRKVNPRDIGGQADKFCIVKLENGQEEPVFNIEYKPPFKFLAADICQGLQGEIFPDQDLINKEDEALEYCTRRRVSVVITQLFSYLIKTGVRYGYVSTGRMMIFLHISDNAEQVKYHLWNSLDFDLNHPAFLHNTAIAEVIAFSLQALAAEPPVQRWHDSAAELTLWALERVDILKNIPQTAEKERINETPDYIASRSANRIYRSPIALRSRHGAKHIASKEENEEKDKTESLNHQTRNSRCRPQDLEVKDESGDSSDGQSEGSPLGPSRVKRSKMGRAGKKWNGNGDKAVGKHTENFRKRVHERDYCSLPCLLGLAHGGYLDPNCPNIADHGKKHLKRPDFLRLVREQLARDRGHITDCEPLWIGGSRGAMFKVTLTSHGYTVIAKGVQRHNVPHLLQESKVYRHLRPIQGIHIPVCLGSTNLVLQYYHNCVLSLSELRRCACLSSNQQGKQSGYVVQHHSRHSSHPSTSCPSL